jgi:phosphatidylglycerophosphate synthase
MTTSAITETDSDRAPDRHRDVVRRLAAAQKSSKGAPAYSRFVNRPFGRHLAAIAFRLEMTPNAVTAVSALFTFAAIALIATVHPSLIVGAAVAVLLVVGYALDAADGQLARLRGGGSVSGEWLDHVVDATKIPCLHLAVLVGLYRFSEFRGTGWLLVPIGLTVVATVSFFAMILNDQLRRQSAAATGGLVDRGVTSGLRSLLVLPTDYGLLCVVFLAWGYPSMFVLIYSVIAACSTLYLGAGAVKWFREMSRLAT